MNRVVSISLKLVVAAVWCASSPRVAADTCYMLTNGLVNWWPANGSVLDAAGANHATMLNGVTYTTGKVGQAFSFNDTNQIIMIGAAPLSPPWTAEFWVNRQDSPLDSAVLIGDTNTALKLEQYNFTRKVGFTKWTIADYSFNYIVPTNQWTHLVFVGTTSNTALYVNGAFLGSTNVSISLPRGQLGNDITNRNPSFGRKPLKGLLDETSLYNRALSAGEIQSLYLAGTAGKCRVGFSPILIGWGANYNGQIPQPLGATNIKAIAAGGSHSMALLSNGVVRVWGNNDYGQTNVPSGISNATSVAAGGWHNMALLSNGVVRAWGYNWAGQTNVPAGLSNIMAIAAGSSHSLGLSNNGTVRAWGYNSYGQTNVPAGLSNVRAIAAGGSHSLVLLSNGMVRAWGDNSYGQTNVPAGLSNVRAIAAGGSHSLVLLSNGMVRAWGDNSYGQTNVPAGLSNVMAIAAGDWHSLAVLSNGMVRAWGDNSYGQTNVPAGLSNVIIVAASGSHTLSLTYARPPRPANDNFENATQITGSAVTVTGANIDSSKQPGEQVGFGQGSGSTIWWKWTALTNGDLTIDSSGSSLVPLLGIVTGNSPTNLVTLQHDVGSAVTYSLITNYPVAAGQPYWIAVEGMDGDQGEITLNLQLVVGPTPPNDKFENSQLIVGSNIVFRATNYFSAVEPAEPPYSFSGSYGASRSVWFKWTAPFTGGAVIFGDGSAFGEEDLDSAVIAVYTGTVLTNLTELVVDASLDAWSGIGVGYGGPSLVRVAFNAVSNETYHIAINGLNGGRGMLDLNLRLFPPPVNDAFSNRASIMGNHFQTTGTFIGATVSSNEIEELNYPLPYGLDRTLWWSWTAPTNNGVSNSEVRLLVSGVSFPPGISVYESANPTNPPINYNDDLLHTGLGSFQSAMTRRTFFQAQAGQTYNIVVSGKQFARLAGFVSPRFGDYTFTFQNRVLAMMVANPTWEVDGVNNTSFTNDVVVRNFGASISGPLRILVSAISGVSVTRIDNETVVGGDRFVITNLPTIPFSLAPGQTNVVAISGVIPPPLYLSSTNAKGYAAYAQLQEQSFPGIWTTIDQVFVVYGVWPTNSGVQSPQGPGGGVIRIDPGPSGGDTRELIDLDIVGPGAVREGALTPYTGAVAFDDGFQTNVTTANWGSTAFSITNGLFAAGSVQSNTPVTLTLGYPSAGFLYSIDRGILVSNLPPPTLGQATLVAPTSLVFQIQGVPNRKHEIQTATNLNPPVVWTKISTNTVGVNGLLNVTNVIGTNSQRFFRAREAE